MDNNYKTITNTQLIIKKVDVVSMNQDTNIIDFLKYPILYEYYFSLTK